MDFWTDKTFLWDQDRTIKCVIIVRAFREVPVEGTICVEHIGIIFIYFFCDTAVTQTHEVRSFPLSFLFYCKLNPVKIQSWGSLAEKSAGLFCCPKGGDRVAQETQKTLFLPWRSPVSKKRYGRTWKKIRDAYVASHPLCELCLKHGRYVVAEEVHHKKPLAEGGTHAWNNLIALCKACHARIHAKRGDRWHQKITRKNGLSE